MLQTFEVKGYRKFDRLRLDHLKRFNFFVGDNNVGKTSLLASVFGWACGFNLAPFFSIAVSRDYQMGQMTAYSLSDNIKTSFHEISTDADEMHFLGREEDGMTRTFRHRVRMMGNTSESNATERLMMPGLSFIVENHQLRPMPEQVVARWQIISEEKNRTFDIGVPMAAIPVYPPNKMARYIGLLGHQNQSDTIKIYRELKTKGRMEAFLQDFQEVFPDVENLESIPYPDAMSAPISLKLRSGRLLPLYAFGEGLQRWYYILGVIVLNPGGIFCIDEVDATLHPGAQEPFCRNLIRYAVKYDAQVFMTTHNLEFLDHFLSAANEAGTEDFSVTTMRNDGQGRVQVRQLQGRNVFDARKYQLELR
ncbi:ATP/GTP-binding protein [uncultured Selenomonas sp.]|uniref:AAA family ATPase n=1 Tax=uncultured Selenomonas sp. TaxID=159275 RepID=UPI0025D9A111|nr:ATP-binding protein [uncultured Selenomonas sp.]